MSYQFWFFPLWHHKPLWKISQVFCIYYCISASIRTCKKRKKTIVNMKKKWDDPPPKCENSHMFFFSSKSGKYSTSLTLQQQFLHFFSLKSSSNWKPNGSFGICSSWQFRNTPYMLNLKFWLRYLRLRLSSKPVE